MNKLHRRRQMHVVGTGIAAHAGRGERQHRPQTFAACIDQMRRHFRDTRCMFGRHPLLDHLVYSVQILSQSAGQTFVRFSCGVIKAHAQFRYMNGQRLKQVLRRKYERAFADKRPDSHCICDRPSGWRGYNLLYFRRKYERAGRQHRHNAAPPDGCGQRFIHCGGRNARRGHRSGP